MGPLRYDHAEYVFGNERPTLFARGAGRLAAVAEYLNITGKNYLTRWRFVDATDVPAGTWLKYDEEALIFKALHELKQDPDPHLAIQRTTSPISDETDTEANEKRISSAKG